MSTQQIPDVWSMERTQSARLFVIAVLATVVSIFSIAYAWYAQHTYVRQARTVYVKLSPNGTWDVDADLSDNVGYFPATLRQTLFEWTERRYSKRPATVIDDWNIANQMYSPALQKWFQGEFNAGVTAGKLASCQSCEQIIVRPRTLQHLDEVPTNPGHVDSDPIRTLVYATEQTVPPGSAKPTKEVRQVYKITWRFLSKASIQSQPDMLRYNPVGVQILDVEVTQDTN